MLARCPRITQGDFAITDDTTQDRPGDRAAPSRFYVGPAAGPAFSAISADPPSQNPSKGFQLAADQQITLDPDQSRHALRVLRLSEGSDVQLLDGRGGVAQATILTPAGKLARCRVLSVDHRQPPSPRLTLATAIPKGPRGDAMVNDLAQLGVDTLIPLRTERSVVDPRDSKLEKYQRAAIEAAKQCGRAWMMGVQGTMDFEQAVEIDAGLKLVADPAGEPASAVLGDLGKVQNVLILIGPEGGLTDAETALALERGGKRWAYNDNVLRIETAACAAAAILRSQS